MAKKSNLLKTNANKEPIQNSEKKENAALKKEKKGAGRTSVSSGKKKVPFYKDRFIILVTLVSLIRLWITSDVKLIAIPSTTDDFHYTLLAYFIKTGKWLGPLDQLTLHTRSFFSVFLAYLSQFKIPLIFANHFLYVTSVAFGFFTLRKIIKNDWVIFAGFVFVIFNPMFYAGDMCRVVREGMWVPLSIIIVFSYVRLLFLEENFYMRIFYSVLCGLGMTAFYLTREDGLIIFPVAFFLCVSYLVVNFGRFKTDKVKNISLLLLSFVLVKIFVMWNVHLNYKHYKANFTYEGEMKSIAAFNSALGSIQQDTVIKGIPYSKATRMKLYEYLPTFAKLKPYEPVFMGWSEKEGPNKGELMHFGTALKWALYRAGYYESYSKLDEFYKSLAADIQKAIEEGHFNKIESHPLQKYSPFIDLNKFDLGFIVSTMGYGTNFAIELNDFKLLDTHEFGSVTDGDAETINIFKIVTNSELAFTKAEATPANLDAQSHTFKNVLLQFNYNVYSVITKYLFYLSLLAFIVIVYFSLKTKQFLPLIILTTCLIIIVIRIFILANLYTSNNLFSVKYLAIVHAFVFIHISFAFGFLFHFLAGRKLKPA